MASSVKRYLDGQEAQVNIRETNESRITDLLTANHILADQGVLDAFGHVSVRSFENPAKYFLSRSRSPALITRRDILEFDQDSNPLDPRGWSLYGERFIHGEIYRARPDVQGIVHSHAPATLPFGVTGVPLQPVIHMAGFLPQQVTLFEIRDVAGPENGMLIVNRDLGQALGRSLGAECVVLMRGHGMTVVGPSVRHATSRAIYTQLNAQIALEALKLGPIISLNATEAKRVNEVNEGLLLSPTPRSWELWETQAKARGLHLAEPGDL